MDVVETVEVRLKAVPPIVATAATTTQRFPHDTTTSLQIHPSENKRRGTQYIIATNSTGVRTLASPDHPARGDQRSRDSSRVHHLDRNRETEEQVREPVTEKTMQAHSPDDGPRVSAPITAKNSRQPGRHHGDASADVPARGAAEPVRHRSIPVTTIDGTTKITDERAPVPRGVHGP